MIYLKVLDSIRAQQSPQAIGMRQERCWAKVIPQLRGGWERSQCASLRTATLIVAQYRSEMALILRYLFDHRMPQRKARFSGRGARP